MTKSQIIAAVVLTAVFCFEQYFPNRKRVPFWWAHLRRNCVLGGINGLLTAIFSTAFSIGMIAWAETHSIGLLRFVEWPRWIEFSTAFLAFDFWNYGWHWMNHQIPFLWRFHRVHHNDPAMDMSTALRFHPGEIFFSTFLNIPIIALIGMDLGCLVVYKALFQANILFHHSNFRITEKADRIMRVLLVSPNMHRVHHSQILQETDSNYSSFFSFWDRLCGTYRRRDTAQIVFGLDRWMEERWQTVLGLLKLPIQNFRK